MTPIVPSAQQANRVNITTVPAADSVLLVSTHPGKSSTKEVEAPAMKLSANDDEVIDFKQQGYGTSSSVARPFSRTIKVSQRPRRPVIDPGPPPDLGPLAQWVVGQERDDPTRGPEGLTGLSAQQQAHLAVHKDWDPFHELQYPKAVAETSAAGSRQQTILDCDTTRTHLIAAAVAAEPYVLAGAHQETDDIEESFWHLPSSLLNSTSASMSHPFNGTRKTLLQQTQLASARATVASGEGDMPRHALLQGVPLNLAPSLAVQTAQPSTPVASSPGRASTPGSPCSPAPATEEVPARGSPVSVHHGAAGRLMELTHLQQQAHATPSRLGQIDVVLARPGLPPQPPPSSPPPDQPSGLMIALLAGIDQLSKRVQQQDDSIRFLLLENHRISQALEHLQANKLADGRHCGVWHQ